MADLSQARRLHQQAAAIQRDIRASGLLPPPGRARPRFELLVTDDGLRNATHRLYQNGHYARAVEEGMKYVAEQVRQRTGLAVDGTALMELAFSPTAPVLQLNRMKTQSDRDEQKGFMMIFSGSVAAIRNPRAHRQGHEDSPDAALELLVWANHLTRIIQSARLRRRRSKR